MVAAFQGMRIYFDETATRLPGFPAQNQRDQLITVNGGNVVAKECEATHIVVHSVDPSAANAAAQLTESGAQLCSVVYFFACLEHGAPLHPDAHRLYRPLPAAAIPGAADFGEVTLTGFTGMNRTAIQVLIESAGLRFSKMLTYPKTPTAEVEQTALLLAKDVAASSPKTDVAHQHAIPVVNLHWLLDSLTQWQLLPPKDYTVDAGEVSFVFTEPPPQPSPSHTPPFLDVARGTGIIMDSEDDEEMQLQLENEDAVPDTVEQPQHQPQEEQQQYGHNNESIPTAAAAIAAATAAAAPKQPQHQQEEEQLQEEQQQYGHNNQSIPTAAAIAAPKESGFGSEFTYGGGVSGGGVTQAMNVVGGLAANLYQETEIVDDGSNGGGGATVNVTPPSKKLLAAAARRRTTLAAVEGDKNRDEEILLEAAPEPVENLNEERNGAAASPPPTEKITEAINAPAPANVLPQPIAKARKWRKSAAVPAPETEVVENEKKVEKERKKPTTTKPKKTLEKEAPPPLPPPPPPPQKKATKEKEKPQKRKAPAAATVVEEDGDGDGGRKRKKVAAPSSKEEKPPATVEEDGDGGRPTLPGRQRKKVAAAAPSSSKEEEKPRPPPRAFIALSGLHSNQQKDLRQKLAKVKDRDVDVAAGTSDGHAWQPEFTHIIAPVIKRNQKCLAALAAGNVWLVSPEFATACAASRKLVDEEPFELEKGSSGGIDPGVAQFWRRHHKRTGLGAFSGLTFAVIKDTDGDDTETLPSSEDIKAIITAGGGVVITRQQQPCDVVVVSTADAHAKVLQSIAVQRQAKRGALCVASKYVVDWVAQPSMSLDLHVLLGSQRSEVVESAEAVRREGGGGDKEDEPQSSISL